MKRTDFLVSIPIGTLWGIVLSVFVYVFAFKTQLPVWVTFIHNYQQFSYIPGYPVIGALTKIFLIILLLEYPYPLYSPYILYNIFPLHILSVTYSYFIYASFILIGILQVFILIKILRFVSWLASKNKLSLRIEKKIPLIIKPFILLTIIFLCAFLYDFSNKMFTYISISTDLNTLYSSDTLLTSGIKDIKCATDKLPDVYNRPMYDCFYIGYKVYKVSQGANRKPTAQAINTSLQKEGWKLDTNDMSTNNAQQIFLSEHIPVAWEQWLTQDTTLSYVKSDNYEKAYFFTISPIIKSHGIMAKISDTTVFNEYSYQMKDILHNAYSFNGNQGFDYVILIVKYYDTRWGDHWNSNSPYPLFPL